MAGAVRTFLSNSGTEAVEARAQARPSPHQSPQRHRLPRWVPRAFARQPVAHCEQGAPARRFRHRHARQLPRPVLEPLRRTRSHRCRLHRAGPVHEAHRSAGRRSSVRRADSGRRRLHRPAVRMARLPCASSATATASCLVLDEVQVRDRAHRHDVGVRARRGRARRHVRRQGPRQRPTPRRHRTPRSELMDWEPGASRLDVRWQSRLPPRRRSRRSTSSENGLADNAARWGTSLPVRDGRAARDLPLIEQVRGRGLMIGLDAPDHDAADELQEACSRRGSA